MELPVQITLRGFAKSAALEEAICSRAAKLEHVYDRLVSCRVAVELEGSHSQQGREFSVRIALKVPGDEIVVNREHSEDVYLALREAFDTARRQLDELRKASLGRRVSKGVDGPARITRALVA